MAKNRKLKVFLCHSKDDKVKVRDLYYRLATDDFDVWLDEVKLIPGQDWDLEIRKAIRDSDAVVICLSNNTYTKTGYVQKEILTALDVAQEQPEGAIYLIPARFEDCQVRNELSKLHWVNLFDETGYEKLYRALLFRANTLGIELLPNPSNITVDVPIIKELDERLPKLIDKALSEKELLKISKSFFPKGIKSKGLFAFEFKGESLADILINNGDFIIMENSSLGKIKNGEMAAIWLSKNKEIVFKYFYKEKDGYRLQPASSKFKPIKVGKDEPLEIKGKVVMVIRKVKE